jgi:hypothetical protein
LGSSSFAALCALVLVALLQLQRASSARAPVLLLKYTRRARIQFRVSTLITTLR